MTRTSAWRDVNLSLLRGFPHASLTATDLSVSGVHAFGQDTLFATRQLRFVLDVRSVIGISGMGGRWSFASCRSISRS
jgi:hypothetical protein